jgi:hypothetical protein
MAPLCIMIFQVEIPSPLLLSSFARHSSISEFEEGDYNGNGLTSIFDSSVDEPMDDELDLSSPEKLGEENFDLEDESGMAITSLECVLWKNNEFNHGATTGSPRKSNLPSTRIEWTIMVGDSAGRITLLDITDVCSYLFSLIHFSPLDSHPNWCCRFFCHSANCFSSSVVTYFLNSALLMRYLSLSSHLPIGIHHHTLNVVDEIFEMA